MRSSTKSSLRVSEELQQNLLEKANEFVAALRQMAAQRTLRWHEPSISYDAEDGVVEISWWREKKSLIATIEPDGAITFLKVWGAHVYNEMVDIENPTDDQIVDLWQWLYA